MMCEWKGFGSMYVMDKSGTPTVRQELTANFTILLGGLDVASEDDMKNSGENF
jgi:hypothetical protein